MPKIELSASQVNNLIKFFEFSFIDLIRDDREIDNIEYLCDMCEIYTKLKAAQKEVGRDG